MCTGYYLANFTDGCKYEKCGEGTRGVMQWCIRGVRVNCCTTMWRSSIWLVLLEGGGVGLLGIRRNDQSLICFLRSKTQSKPALKVVVTGWTTLLTKHNQFSWITVFLSNHVGPNTHIHASITFLGVRNHQLPSSDLKMTARGGGRSQWEREKRNIDTRFMHITWQVWSQTLLTQGTPGQRPKRYDLLLTVEHGKPLTDAAYYSGPKGLSFLKNQQLWRAVDQCTSGKQGFSIISHEWSGNWLLIRGFLADWNSPPLIVVWKTTQNKDDSMA